MPQGETYSYTQRSVAKAQWDQLYERFLSGLQLAAIDRSALKQRGLTEQQIDSAGYKTKPKNNDQQLQKCIATLVNSGQTLDKVPGFFQHKNTGAITTLPAAGIVVPSRDLQGDINSLVIRKEEHSRGKYIAFSTPANKYEGGASVRNTTHCPITHSFTSKQAMGTTLRITEGVLKADVACALDPTIYTLGLPGLNAPDDLKSILQTLEISRVLLAFDMESTVDVKLKSVKLLNTLKQDYDVTFEEWDPAHKGIDDALLKAKDSIRALDPEELNNRLKSIAGNDPLSGDYIYVVSVQRFFHVEDLTELTKSQFSDTHAMNGEGEVTELLSGDTQPLFPRCNEVEFAPGQPHVFQQGRKSIFNLWRPPAYEPEEGDVAKFLNHMEYILPQQEERELLLQWMAHQAQHLGEKIHWAVLLQGEPGIGKSFIGNVMAAILGKQNISRPTNTELHENFTSWEKCCSLVIVEEVMAGERKELMNKLKPKITEPVTRIREMHKAPYTQPNRYNMLMLTNHDDAIIIDESDRRYYVLSSRAKHRSVEYYQSLFEWISQPATKSALLHWAANYPLAGFNAKGHAPKTEARAKLIHDSRSRLEEFVMSGVEENRWPFSMDIVSVYDLKSSKQIPSRLTELHERFWTKALQLAGAKPILEGNQISVLNVGRRRFWAIRRPEIWLDADMKPAKVIEEYNKWINSQPGGNPLDDIAPLSA